MFLHKVPWYALVILLWARVRLGFIRSWVAVQGLGTAGKGLPGLGNPALQGLGIWKNDPVTIFSIYFKDSDGGVVTAQTALCVKAPNYLLLEYSRGFSLFAVFIIYLYIPLDCNIIVFYSLSILQGSGHP